MTESEAREKLGNVNKVIDRLEEFVAKGNEKIDGVLDLIGNTPMIEITRLNPYRKKGIRIFAKLEGQNPGGSIKDRIALNMIERAEERGELDKNKTIIEATSGNTGIGIAMVAAVKGLKVDIVMSEGASIERRKVIEAFGANVILSPANESTDGAIRMVAELIEKNPGKYVHLDQFSNDDNWKAHYENTAMEIINQVPFITHFTTGLGTTGTIMGIARRLKEYNPDIKITAIEPTVRHALQGLKNMDESIVPKIYKSSEMDELVTAQDDVSFYLAKRLMKEQGIFAGISSGASLFGALDIARRMEEAGEEGNIVTIFPDRAEKYLSTPLIQGD